MRYDLTLEQGHCPGVREISAGLSLQRVADRLLAGDADESRRAATEVLNSRDQAEAIINGSVNRPGARHVQAVCRPHGWSDRC